MDTRPDVDPDGFPLFPAMPGGTSVPVTARSLARLVAGIRGTAVLTAMTESVAAMVIFLDREPVDGFAVTTERRVSGPDVLDEIAEVPIEAIAVTEVSPALAVVLGSYFLPTEIRDVPAAVILPDQFIRSLGKPGQRGCVLIRAGDALGLVFIGGGEVRLACRADSDRLGGMEQVRALLEDPGARLWVRIGPDPGLELPATPELEEATDGLPRASAPVPAPAALDWAPEPVTPAEPPSPSPVSPSWYDPHPAVAPVGEETGLLGAVLAELRQVLGPHSVRIEGIFLHAEPTAEGLRAAAESLPDRRIRLISRSTLELAAERALAVLDRQPV